MKLKLKDGFSAVKENQVAPPVAIAAVAIPLPVDECFSYAIPGHLTRLAGPGKRVLVPFGNRLVTGYLIGPARKPGPPETKQILDVLDDTPLFPPPPDPLFRMDRRLLPAPLGAGHQNSPAVRAQPG